jgi:hypothetical protein
MVALNAKRILFLTLITPYVLLAKGQGDSGSLRDDVRRLNHVSPRVLVDGQSGKKFILDSTRTSITAVDRRGNIIWKTNPAVDNNLFNRGIESDAYIKRFVLAKEKWSLGKEEIYITYNYNLFGYLDKKNGKWKYIGRD